MVCILVRPVEVRSMCSVEGRMDTKDTGVQFDVQDVNQLEFM